MKYITICLLFFISGCGNNGTESSLTGTYTAYHEHEFGKTNDTLIVSKPNNGEK